MQDGVRVSSPGAIAIVPPDTPESQMFPSMHIGKGPRHCDAARWGIRALALVLRPWRRVGGPLLTLLDRLANIVHVLSQKRTGYCWPTYYHATQSLM